MNSLYPYHETIVEIVTATVLFICMFIYIIYVHFFFFFFCIEFV